MMKHFSFILDVSAIRVDLFSVMEADEQLGITSYFFKEIRYKYSRTPLRLRTDAFHADRVSGHDEFTSLSEKLVRISNCRNSEVRGRFFLVTKPTYDMSFSRVL